jgi:hypothetical protein
MSSCARRSRYCPATSFFTLTRDCTILIIEMC